MRVCSTLKTVELPCQRRILHDTSHDTDRCGLCRPVVSNVITSCCTARIPQRHLLRGKRVHSPPSCARLVLQHNLPAWQHDVLSRTRKVLFCCVQMLRCVSLVFPMSRASSGGSVSPHFRPVVHCGHVVHCGKCRVGEGSEHDIAPRHKRHTASL